MQIVRCCRSGNGHWLLVQAVHVPLAVSDAPFKNWFAEHFGWSLQMPLVASDAPCKNWFVEHFGWSLHSYPLVEPEHEPVRYCVVPHSTLLQAVQVALLLLLNRLYWPLGHCVRHLRPWPHSSPVYTHAGGAQVGTSLGDQQKSAGHACRTSQQAAEEHAPHAQYCG